MPSWEDFKMFVLLIKQFYILKIYQNSTKLRIYNFFFFFSQVERETTAFVDLREKCQKELFFVEFVWNELYINFIKLIKMSVIFGFHYIYWLYCLQKKVKRMPHSLYSFSTLSFWFYQINFFMNFRKNQECLYKKSTFIERFVSIK